MAGNLTQNLACLVGHLTSCNDYLLIIYVVYIDAKFTFEAHNSLNIKFENYTTSGEKGLHSLQDVPLDRVWFLALLP